MKRIISSLLLMVICVNAFAQSADSTSIIATEYDKIFTKVEQPAKFPGGDEMFARFIDRNINLKAIAPFITDAPQTAIIKFIVDAEGLVSHVSVVNANGVNPILAEEAMKLIKRGPKWQPAIQNGRNVVYRVLQSVVLPTTAEAKAMLAVREKDFANKVFTKATDDPLFPGGTEGFNKYINDNYNKKKLSPYLNSVPQTVRVQCLIDNEGNIAKAQVIYNRITRDRSGATTEEKFEKVDPVIADEAVRLIIAGPKWKPAYMYGNAVTFQALVPVTFFKL